MRLVKLILHEDDAMLSIYRQLFTLRRTSAQQMHIGSKFRINYYVTFRFLTREYRIKELLSEEGSLEVRHEFWVVITHKQYS